MAAISGACAELGDEVRFEPSAEPVEITSSVPATGSSAVDPGARFDLCFSTEIDPRIPDDFDLNLRSATLTFDTELSVQMFSWRAPGQQDAIAAERWCPGSVLSITPKSPLQPGITYRARLRAIDELGWRGQGLDLSEPGWTADEEGNVTRWFEFTVAGDIGDPAPEEVPTLEPGPTLAALFTDGAVFDPERGACSCHQGSDALALARLDLRTAELAFESLVLRDGLEPTGVPMVNPGRPSESYLLHKLHRTASGEAQHGIAGAAMPPGEPLPFADWVAVARWIADGAQP